MLLLQISLVCKVLYQYCLRILFKSASRKRNIKVLDIQYYFLLNLLEELKKSSYRQSWGIINSKKKKIKSDFSFNIRKFSLFYLYSKIRVRVNVIRRRLESLPTVLPKLSGINENLFCLLNEIRDWLKNNFF